MTTVWIYVDTNKDVGEPDHLKVFATPEAADEWFEVNDPGGVAFGYEILGDETRPRSYCPICGALIDLRDLAQIDYRVLGSVFGREGPAWPAPEDRKL
jgi:hypothetical protein